MNFTWVYGLGTVCALALATALASGADRPQWGEAWSRNMTSPEQELPSEFDLTTGKNVKWTIDLGTESHASPVIAGGRIYIGTNNGRPRDPKHQGDRGVLFCLDEATGKLLWQLVVPKRTEDIYFDWPKSGICSPPSVEGDRVYLVSNRGEVMCLDAHGMANGNQGPYQDEGAHMTPKSAEQKLEPGPLDADILWLFDLTDGAGIWSHDAAHSSVLIHGDYLYLNTGTGVDNTHRKIRLPDAPSLVVMDKRTGRLVAREREGIGPNIFHSTWAAPSLGDVRGRPQLFFSAGNGIVYSFAMPAPEQLAAAIEPLTLQRIWHFDFDPTAPKTNVHTFVGNRRESPSDFFGLPVFHRGRLYVAGGGDIWWGKDQAWIKCLRTDGEGDITDTGLVWSQPLEKHVLATPAVGDGLVFIADCGGKLHCLDADTGDPVWQHDLGGEIWASPLLADGKVYLGSRRGSFLVFKASREKQVLCTVSGLGPISATATAANGVVYLATMKQLYALAATPAAPSRAALP